MALKNTDRVSTARVAPGDVLLRTIRSRGDGSIYAAPATALKGADWATVVEVVPVAATSSGGFTRSGPRRYLVTFEGSVSEPLAGVQHWTRKLPGVAPLDATTETTEPGALVVPAPAAPTMTEVLDQLDDWDREPAPTTVEDEPITVPDATDGDRCGTCRGFGLVRGVGSRVGRHFRTLAGAQASLNGGRATDCPTCDGLGLVNLRELVQA